MNSIRLLAALMCLLIILTGCSTMGQPAEKAKFVIILQAGTEGHEGQARALHALLYSAELLEAGHKAVLIFDGAGTEWAEALRNPEHRLHPLYKKVTGLGIVEEVCDFCTGAFDVKEELKVFGNVPFSGEYNGHPSLLKWIAAGYRILIL